MLAEADWMMRMEERDMAEKMASLRLGRTDWEIAFVASVLVHLVDFSVLMRRAFIFFLVLMLSK